MRTKGERPGAPTDVRAVPTGPTTGEVTWREPKANDDILGYTLTYTLRSIGECGPSTARPITKQSRDPHIDLDGLIPDSTYDITVTARTAGGEGPPSQLVTMRTEEARK